MIPPRIFLSHQTASKYWSRRDLDETKKTRAIPAPSDIQSAAALNDARRLVLGLDENETLHALVANERNKHHVENISFHHRDLAYPKWSFRQINRDTYVASPELCFLEAATYLPFEALVLYGMELCGTYARIGNEETRYKREPLTSKQKITAYLDKSKGMDGVKLARKACQYVLNGSASPRESILAITMTLPRRLGGFGMPAPLLNHEIQVNLPSKVHFGKKQILHGDIVWREANLIVEYDGSQHGIEDNHVSDKKRDHLMLEAGYDVVRFTDKSIRSGTELERLARTINRKAGLNRRKENLRYDFEKSKLLSELLFRSDPPWL